MYNLIAIGEPLQKLEPVVPNGLSEVIVRHFALHSHFKEQELVLLHDLRIKVASFKHRQSLLKVVEMGAKLENLFPEQTDIGDLLDAIQYTAPFLPQLGMLSPV